MMVEQQQNSKCLNFKWQVGGRKSWEWHKVFWTLKLSSVTHLPILPNCRQWGSSIQSVRAYGAILTQTTTAYYHLRNWVSHTKPRTQWFSTFLMLQPFKTVPPVVVKPQPWNYFVATFKCNFDTVMNHNINIWYAGYLICLTPKESWPIGISELSSYTPENAICTLKTPKFLSTQVSGSKTSA